MPPDINLIDADSYALNGPPYDQFRWLRDQHPVFWHELGGENGWPGFWAITRHADVEYVSRHPDVFSSHRRLALFQEMPQPSAIAAQRLMMLNMDPPQHTRQRRFVSRGFTPRMISQLEEKIRQICNALVDDVAHRGEADLLRDISAPLPLRVLCMLLGAPAEDHDYLLGLSTQIVGGESGDPQDADDPAAEEAMASAATEYFIYANDLARERRANPVDDIVSQLLRPDDNGELLTAEEFDYFMLMLAVAGTETTRNASAAGLLAFFQHPEQWQRLRADRRLIPTAVEEIVRWVTPVNLFRRTASRDTEIAGQRISEGDKVVVFYSAANRDEDAFANPSAFDIGRDPNPHLGFGGGGPHFCLGRHLAALQLRVLLETLLQRMPDLTQAGEAVRVCSYFSNGISQLPVRFTPSAPLAAGLPAAARPAA